MKSNTFSSLRHFRLSTDFLSSDSMLILRGRHGMAAPLLALMVMSEIYRNGYFVHLTEKLKYTLLRDLPGTSPEQFDAIMADLARLGYIDKAMLGKNILTSEAIQREYFRRCRRRRDVDYPHLLIALAEVCPFEEEKPVTYTMADVEAAAKSPQVAVYQPQKADLEEMFRRYNANGWRDRSRRPIRDLPACLAEWLSGGML